MTEIKADDITGYSNSGIDEALQDALEKVGEYARVEIAETRGSRAKGNSRPYQVTLATFDE